MMSINGFDRVSAPISTRNECQEGFLGDEDSGVAYLRDVAYIGQQRVFDPAQRKAPNQFNELGASYSNYEGRIAGGNTFDYPALHGKAIAAAGYSFASTSAKAVEDGRVALDEYGAIDLILGKQRTVSLGCGHSGYDFKAFPKGLQEAIRNYTTSGGGLFVSGSYIATDLWFGAESDQDDQTFAKDILHFGFGGSAAVVSGAVSATPSWAKLRGDYHFNQQFCEECYKVDAPDAMHPTNGAFPVMHYNENGRIAGVAWTGDYRTLALGFPFESLTDHEERNRLMLSVMEFLFRQGGTDFMR